MWPRGCVSASVNPPGALWEGGGCEFAVPTPHTCILLAALLSPTANIHAHIRCVKARIRACTCPRGTCLVRYTGACMYTHTVFSKCRGCPKLDSSKVSSIINGKKKCHWSMSLVASHSSRGYGPSPTQPAQLAREEGGYDMENFGRARRRSPRKASVERNGSARIRNLPRGVLAEEGEVLGTLVCFLVGWFTDSGSRGGVALLSMGPALPEGSMPSSWCESLGTST